LFSLLFLCYLFLFAGFHGKIILRRTQKKKKKAAHLPCFPTHVTAFGCTTSCLFQLVSVYSLSQNTIESSEIIQNLLFHLPAERGDNLPLHYCICAFVWGLSSLLSPCLYCVINVHSSELLRPHGCNYSGRYVGIMYVVSKKLLLLPAIFLQPCLFDGHVARSSL